MPGAPLAQPSEPLQRALQPSGSRGGVSWGPSGAASAGGEPARGRAPPNTCFLCKPCGSSAREDRLEVAGPGNEPPMRCGCMEERSAPSMDQAGCYLLQLGMNSYFRVRVILSKAEGS